MNAKEIKIRLSEARHLLNDFGVYISKEDFVEAYAEAQAKAPYRDPETVIETLVKSYINHALNAFENTPRKSIKSENDAARVRRYLFNEYGNAPVDRATIIVEIGGPNFMELVERGYLSPLSNGNANATPTYIIAQRNY